MVADGLGIAPEDAVHLLLFPAVAERGLATGRQVIEVEGLTLGDEGLTLGGVAVGEGAVARPQERAGDDDLDVAGGHEVEVLLEAGDGHLGLAGVDGGRGEGEGLLEGGDDVVHKQTR